MPKIATAAGIAAAAAASVVNSRSVIS